MDVTTFLTMLVVRILAQVRVCLTVILGSVSSLFNT